ncbi:MAG: aminotransferase class III-fold pyridoxal phosphate-dependent enzyme, partial [Thermoplasmata archaeon]
MITPKEVHDVLGRRILADGFDMVLDLEKSQGVWIYDSRYDRKFLDFFGFFATSAVGMNHPKMFEPEFLKKVERAAINKPTNSDVYTVEMAEFVDTLSRLATPSYMKYFFFIEGGALAVENALKTAFDWKVKKNFKKGYKEERGYKVIHLREAFHGRSGYTLSLTNTFDPRKTQYFPKFNWPRITNPKITFPLNKENLKKVEELEKKSIEEMENAIRDNPDEIAAFIMEPIQGEGGDNHFRKEYFKEVERITKKNDIMFIVDEVQSGMGITGKWWA